MSFGVVLVLDLVLVSFISNSSFSLVNYLIAMSIFRTCLKLIPYDIVQTGEVAERREPGSS